MLIAFFVFCCLAGFAGSHYFDHWEHPKKEQIKKALQLTVVFIILVAIVILTTGVRAKLLQIFLIACCVALFITFRQVRKGTHPQKTLISNIWLCLFIIMTAITTYKLFNRSGTEVYEACLGNPDGDCVDVIEFHDGSTPFFDGDICLYFRTCPMEVQRLLKDRHCSSNRQKADSIFHSGGMFDLRKLGDTVWFFSNIEGSRESGWFFLYTSSDSTKGFYVNNER